MNLYLVQHGIPKPEAEDPKKPLSDQGIKEVKAIAEHLKNTGLRVDEILHSGKLRAEQTAEILGEALNPASGVSKSGGLNPLDDPGIWAERLKDEDRDIMLVGHLPHLERLAGLLICGTPDNRAVTFRMGGVVCLEKTDKNWSFRWAITPELI